MNGYTGKILWVDLTNRTCKEEAIPDEIYEQYLSGSGLGAYIIYHRLPAKADPLGPENILGFVAGVLTGTGAMFSGRWMVVGKSPLTGGWGDANCGGDFGPAIKQCGYDGIFLTGQATTPVYLYADGKTVEIRDAADLWGTDAIETEEILVKRLGNKARVACIGQAGEKVSLIAGIVNDRGRLAARSGLGAVMGSKRLKAVALAGSKKVETARPDEVRKLSKQVAALMPKGGLNMPGWILPVAGWFMMRSSRVFRTDGLMSVGPMRKWGTTSGNEVCIINGDAPIQNWRGIPRQFLSKTVSADAMVRLQKKNYHCSACPLGCGGIIQPKGEGQQESHRPEYETSTSFGALLLNRDLDSIFSLNETLNRAGMDSISAGVAVAFALDCFEHGLLTEKETGGLQLTWGNTEAIVKLVNQMIRREGFGALLADGVRTASARLGPESEAYAIHAGGQELPMHDPRHDPGYGLLYVVDPTPGRHTIGSLIEYEMFRPWTRVSWAPPVPGSYPRSSQYSDVAGTGLKMVICSLLKGVVDSGGFCFLGLNIGVDRAEIFEYMNAATGWDKTPDEYMEAGRRIQDLRQCFNISQGIEPASVTMNPLINGTQAAKAGPLKGVVYDLEGLRHEYWKAMHWDAQNGYPEQMKVAVQ